MLSWNIHSIFGCYYLKWKQNQTSPQHIYNINKVHLVFVIANITTTDIKSTSPCNPLETSILNNIVNVLKHVVILGAWWQLYPPNHTHYCINLGCHVLRNVCSHANKILVKGMFLHWESMYSHWECMCLHWEHEMCVHEPHAT
jgi:hypothetical protein